MVLNLNTRFLLLSFSSFINKKYLLESQIKFDEL